MNEPTTCPKIPAAGYRAAVECCPECLLLLERTAEVLPFPGQQFNCYSCLNRFTVVRTEKQDATLYDRFSGITGYNEKAVSYELRGVVFNRSRYAEQPARNWMIERGLDGFETTVNIGIEFVELAKAKGSPAEADIYVRLADGIFGRVIETSRAAGMED